MSDICKKCGAPLNDGDTFCMNCGANINAQSDDAREAAKKPAMQKVVSALPKPAEQANATEAAKFCMYCGAQLKPGAKFCHVCAADNSGAGQASVPQKKPAAKKSRQGFPKWLMWVIIGLGAAAVIAAVIIFAVPAIFPASGSAEEAAYAAEEQAAEEEEQVVYGEPFEVALLIPGEEYYETDIVAVSTAAAYFGCEVTPYCCEDKDAVTTAIDDIINSGEYGGVILDCWYTDSTAETVSAKCKDADLPMVVMAWNEADADALGECTISTGGGAYLMLKHLSEQKSGASVMVIGDASYWTLQELLTAGVERAKSELDLGNVDIFDINNDMEQMVSAAEAGEYDYIALMAPYVLEYGAYELAEVAPDIPMVSGTEYVPDLQYMLGGTIDEMLLMPYETQAYTLMGMLWAKVNGEKWETGKTDVPYVIINESDAQEWMDDKDLLARELTQEKYGEFTPAIKDEKEAPADSETPTGPEAFAESAEKSSSGDAGTVDGIIITDSKFSQTTGNCLVPLDEMTFIVNGVLGGDMQIKSNPNNLLGYEVNYVLDSEFTAKVEAQLYENGELVYSTRNNSLKLGSAGENQLIVSMVLPNAASGNYEVRLYVDGVMIDSATLFV